MAAASNSEFKLVGPTKEELHRVPRDVPLPCNLSPEISAVTMEIRWFKGTDCVCLYKNRQVTEGKGYEGRVKLFTDELERGNVSLQLIHTSKYHTGDYMCQVTDGDRTEELTLKIDQTMKLGQLIKVYVSQTDRTWTEEERTEMESAVLLTEYQDVKDLARKYQKNIRTLKKTEEILENTQLELDKASQIKDELIKATRANQTHLEEKITQLDESVKISQRALTEKLQEENNQVQEITNVLEEYKTELVKLTNKQLEKETEGQEKDLSTVKRTVKRRNSIDIPPIFSLSVPELRFVLLGKTGSGKSSAGSIILGKAGWSQNDTVLSTHKSEMSQEEVAGRKVTVVDTPDWFVPGVSLEELRQDVRLCVQLSAPGPHAFLLVIPVKQPTGELSGMLEKMEEIFGNRCWRNTLILFTVTDEVQKNIQEFVHSGNQELQGLIEKCENRFHCLNIKESGDGSQVSELLEKIEKMERFYSSEIYLETESQFQAFNNTYLKKLDQMKEEIESKEKLQKDTLKMIEGVIEEHEGEITELNNRTTELERKMKEEADEEKKRELQRALQREVDKRKEMEAKLSRLREKEREEMQKKHQQEIERIREECKIEALAEVKTDLMEVIMPNLQKNMLASKTKMEEEFSRQMEEKNKEIEKLKLKLAELERSAAAVGDSKGMFWVLKDWFLSVE